MSTSPKVNAVAVSFALSFVLTAIAIPITMSLAGSTWQAFDARAVVLVVGVGVLTLITIVIALALALMLRMTNRREVDRIVRETAEIRRQTEQLQWQYRFETYHLNASQQRSSYPRKTLS